MGEVWDWSEVASGNRQVAGLDWREGMPFNLVNDNIVEMMAQMRRGFSLTTVPLEQFGGGSGNATTDQAAWEAARAYLIAEGGGTIRLGRKQYLLNNTFVMDTGSFGIPICVEGDGAASDVLFVGGDVPAIRIGGAQYLRGGGLRNFKLRNQAGAGHLIETGALGAVSLVIQDMTLEQNVANRRILHIPSGEVYMSRFEGGDWTAHPSSTVSPVYVRANGTTFNINTFSNIRCFQSATRQFFDIANTDDETWLVNNAFRDLDFGICAGGGFRLRNVRGTMIENISFFDAGTYVDHLIHFASDSSAGYESTANTLVNIQRHGDALGSGVRDIWTQRADFTVVQNCFTPLDAGPSYDWNNKNVIVMGLLYNEINVTNRTLINGGQVITPTELYSGKAFVDDELNFGGLDNTVTWRVLVSSGRLRFNALTNGQGFSVQSRDSGGVTRDTIITADGFFAPARLPSAVDDAAAAAAGVPIGALYHNAGAVRVRLT